MAAKNKICITIATASCNKLQQIAMNCNTVMIRCDLLQFVVICCKSLQIIAVLSVYLELFYIHFQSLTTFHVVLLALSFTYFH